MVAFGIWRGSWPFAIVGIAGIALLAANWIVATRPMAVRITVDDSGQIREQLIKLGDV